MSAVLYLSTVYQTVGSFFFVSHCVFAPPLTVHQCQAQYLKLDIHPVLPYFTLQILYIFHSYMLTQFFLPGQK